LFKILFLWTVSVLQIYEVYGPLINPNIDLKSFEIFRFEAHSAYLVNLCSFILCTQLILEHVEYDLFSTAC
jgi:hypothetical protein